MNNTKIQEEIEQQVRRILDFISQVLYPRKDMNRELLDKYNVVFKQYINTRNTDDLFSYRDIYHSASPEGAETDYTEGTSLRLNGEYTSLAELFDHLEGLLQEL